MKTRVSSSILLLFDQFINSKYAGYVGQTNISKHVLHLKPVDSLTGGFIVNDESLFCSPQPAILTCQVAVLLADWKICISPLYT